MALKTVFIHNGEAWYLRYVAGQARALGAEVVLLTACPETAFSRQFREGYRHRSSNLPEYELFCYLRWFYLLDYLDREDLESVFYLDSDVVIYKDLSRLYGLGETAYVVVEKESSATHRPGTWIEPYAVGHISFWRRETLRRFCLFLFEDKEKYEEKWRYHTAHGIPGGVSDMLALYLFYLEEGRKIVNLDEVPYLHTFFPNPEVHFLDGLPYTRINGEEKAFWQTLHCQGVQNKEHIPKICNLC